MDKIKEIKMYECIECGQIYNHGYLAKDCVTKHNEIRQKQKLTDIKTKYFPPKHPKDDRFNKYCTQCGTKVVEFAKVWDGHRYDTGTKITLNEYQLIFGSRCCDSCAKHLEERILTLLEKEWFATIAGSKP